MTALLTIFSDSEEKVITYATECRRMGIKILPPHINDSDEGFKIEGNNIRFGLKAIKGLGEAVVANIIKSRPFDSLEVMIQSMPKRELNKRSLDVLTRSGTLDSLEPDESNRLEILKKIYSIRGDKLDDLLDEMLIYSEKSRLEEEKRLLGVYISGNPLDDIAQPVNWDFIGDMENFDTAAVIESVRVITTKRGDKMAFVKAITLEGEKEFTLFPNVYETVANELKVGITFKTTCYMKYSPQYDNRSILVKKITIPKRINKHILNAV